MNTGSDRKDAAPIRFRRLIPADTGCCGQIIYAAFKAVAERHGFPPDFPSVEAATALAKDFIQHPGIYGVAAVEDGGFVGSNFLDERSLIRGVGPITVDPAAQSRGVGRKLMEKVLLRGRGAKGIRLVQDAFNTASYGLYASLGFVVREPLMLMTGRPAAADGINGLVRPFHEKDLEACGRLCEYVHGFDRKAELSDTAQSFPAFVLVRNGQVRAYLTAANFWPLNHGVADSDEDLIHLIAGAAAQLDGPLSFLLPTRETTLFQWSLSHGFRCVKPMTLMSMGRYQKPAAGFFPSVMF